MGQLNCNDTSQNTMFGENVDFEIVYTGKDFNFGSVVIQQGQDLRSVIMKLAEEVQTLVDSQEPLPVVVFDAEISLETTSTYLNDSYSNLVIGSVVHNGVDYKFIKMTATKWEPQVMNLI